ncbi:unnamed protein product [Adineta steineri]|uniref:Uncharacterized protein n=1 Tax=Adineta steineri TaxID=433720 RepID=A0A819ATA1_9BILA|nr:unnamed protein product [Adineta steineri]
MYIYVIRCRGPKSLGGGAHVLMQLSLLEDYVLAAFVLVSSCVAPRSSSILPIGSFTSKQMSPEDCFGTKDVTPLGKILDIPAQVNLGAMY